MVVAGIGPKLGPKGAGPSNENRTWSAPTACNTALGTSNGGNPCRPLKTSAKPAFILLFLSPLIAEYLLGDLSFAQLTLYPIMVLLYGGGTVVIREVTRKLGRGWPTVLTLGFGYAIIEEGLMTQSLFNRHYLGLSLSDFGWVPALGMSTAWSSYVLGIHVIWSIAVPIALVEALYPEHRRTPWTGRGWFSVFFAVFILGALMGTFGTYQRSHFIASPTQLGLSAALAALFAAVAFAVFGRPQGEPPVNPPGMPRPPWVFGILAFGCGLAFNLTTTLYYHVPALGVVAIRLAILSIPVITFARAWKSRAWCDANADAMAVGAVLVYCVWGFYITVVLHGKGSIPGQCFPVALIALFLVWISARRRRHVAP